MAVARDFYGKFLPELGFVHDSPGDDFHTFYAGGSDRPLEFFAFDEDKVRAVFDVDVEDPFEQPGPAHACRLALALSVLA